MTAQEIYDFTQETLLALARANGVGVDFMEPIVLMGKLRVRRTPEKDEAYYWQQTLLLRVRRERKDDGWDWTFFDAGGGVIAVRHQEKNVRPFNQT